ncbi:MAG: FKBP-type peptidyl-prolyl cis-trans isomerase [Minisyncoccia bacterium]
MNSSTLYTGIAVVLGLAVVAVFFFFPNYLRGLSASGSGNAAAVNASATSGSASTPTNSMNGDSGGLQVQDVSVGTGATAEPGDVVAVEYIGKLADGTIFDQSSAHTDVMPGCPAAGMFCFTLGANQVIAGWDQGLVGMKVGGERILTIPPSLGYGSQQVGPIPPNSTLTFDVKLIGIQSASGTPAQ